MASSPPQPRVGVGALLVVVGAGADAEAPLRVLLGERLGAHGAGRLALPGGHLDFGEASFGACAAREAREETGLALAAGAFATVHATNDVMLGEPGRGAGAPPRDLHYATIFCAALASEAQAAAARNLEPDKCAGWSLAELSALARAPLRERLFAPLRRFLDEGGERRLRGALPEMRARAEAAAAAAAAAAAGGDNVGALAAE